jgi:hypothetical protein
MIVMRISKLFLALLMSLSGAQAMAIEEPVFSVLETASDYEIRRYEPFIVAELDVRGNFDDAGNSAFRILAKYIFGDNSTGEKMKMTAPVKSSSVRMAMTAPVITYRLEIGDWRLEIGDWRLEIGDWERWWFGMDRAGMPGY